jgi:hypothetical protein
MACVYASAVPWLRQTSAFAVLPAQKPLQFSQTIKVVLVPHWGRALGMQAARVLPDREHLLRLRGVDATAAQSDLAESPNYIPRGMKAATAQSDQHIYCVTGHECHRSSVRLAISVCHLITFVQRLNHGAT